jgi:hypothetical protein
MLNIRINFKVDLKKVGIVWATFVLVVSQLALPPTAAALTVPALAEKSVTVNLTYLKVTTTKIEAAKSVASPDAKYFDSETLAFLTTYSQGWSMKEWNCLRSIWQRESHFNPKALNMSSHAFGIAQFLPSTWGNYKVVQTAEAKLQIKYGLRYIKMRYGSVNEPTGACAAWRFWQTKGWY